MTPPVPGRYGTPVPTPVTVVDHGAGNLNSVVRALTHAGADVTVSGDLAVLRRADRLVLPGQGAFGDCMRRLSLGGTADAVREHIAAGRPYLGICLGLQVLFDRGIEHGCHEGLGVLRGEVVPLAPGPGLKVPHMGWNQVHGRLPLLEAAGPDPWVYFVHSYHVVPAEPLDCATTDYGGPFVSAVARDNVFACQFHPEKSQRAGLAMLEAFVA